MRKSSLETLEQIDRLTAKLNERIAQVDEADHVPRTEPLPRGRPMTVFCRCAESCPACALESKYYLRLYRLGDPQRAALREYAHQSAQKQYRRREVNRANARKPRAKRGLSPKSELQLRGLECVLGEFDDITADRLLAMLEVGPLTYEDDDIELSLDGDVVIRNLDSCATIKTATIKKKSLRAYLSNARKN